MKLENLKRTERIFLTAGLFTLLAVPFLGIGGFYLWFIIKLVYLSGIISMFIPHPSESPDLNTGGESAQGARFTERSKS